MVVIRLQRRGTKKVPHHRIVVTERTRSQRGRVIETVGHYDPSYNPPRLLIDEARVAHWTGEGAQVSEAVQKLVKRQQRGATAKAA